MTVYALCPYFFTRKHSLQVKNLDLGNLGTPEAESVSLSWAKGWGCCIWLKELRLPYTDKPGSRVYYIQLDQEIQPISGGSVSLSEWSSGCKNLGKWKLQWIFSTGTFNIYTWPRGKFCCFLLGLRHMPMLTTHICSGLDTLRASSTPNSYPLESA